MTLKELSQLYYLNKEIKTDKERLETLRAKVTSVSGVTVSDMPKGNNQDNQLEKYIAEIVDLEAIISAKLTQCMHERNRLMRYISEIPDSLTRQIFTLRFVNGLSWLQVAMHIGGGNTADSVRKTCNRYINKENGKK